MVSGWGLRRLRKTRWSGMGKLKRGGSGFSSSKAAAPTPKVAKSSTDHATREQQAIALINQGKHEEAEAIYRSLIAAGTRNFNTYNNLGVILKRRGDLRGAVMFYKTAIQLKPNYSEAHSNLAVALKEQGDLAAAIASFNTAIQLKPNLPELHNNLGNALKDQGDLAAAIASYDTALQLNPNYPDAHYNLGNALKVQGDLAAAIASYNTALQLKPSYPEAHCNLAAALQEQGDLAAAIASYNTALQLKPDFPDAYNNLAVALQEQGDLAAAIASYNRALYFKPDFPDAHANLGNALKEHGDLAAAIASYNTALQFRPDFPDAHFNSSLAMLLAGDYKKGWEEYEWRSRIHKKRSTSHARPKCDQWSGELDLNRLSELLLVSEQGLGDSLQFMRYAIVLQNQGISISFCAPSKLHGLIKVSGIDASLITPRQANEVIQGQWMPLLSLPRHLEVSPENPIITEPYIKTTDELNGKWSRILSAEQRPIVGINWQGNPDTEKGHLRGRSLTLNAFEPIMGNSRISLLSLQKGFGSEQLETCSSRDRFVSCQDQVSNTWDFLETAAIIANCDLLITSDTSVAHLAGGMGKTTWLLLHRIPDWRWGLEGDTTFWYPSMKLFRQKERGNWDEVIERVAEELQEHFAGNLEATR